VSKRQASGEEGRRQKGGSKGKVEEGGEGRREEGEVLQPQIKIFGLWDTSNIEVRDPGIRQYINLKPILVPHTGGRHEHRRFMKARVPLVERLANKLMRPGENTGKKVKALNIVKNAFRLVELKTGENPIQVLVRAIENTAPREETTRISYGGAIYFTACDVAPMRRVDLALRFLTEGARKKSFGNRKTIDECLAEEIMLAASNDLRSYAVKQRDQIERIALSAR